MIELIRFDLQKKDEWDDFSEQRYFKGKQHEAVRAVFGEIAGTRVFPTVFKSA